MTVNSFRVRSVEVSYVNPDKTGKSDIHYGYFIENVKRLARRLEYEEVGLPSVNPGDHNSQHIILVSIFRYMIGNTDWSAIQGEPDEVCCHNAKLLKDANNKYVAIPYGFDFSRFVNAEYAYPNPDFLIRSVKQRYFRGFCQADDVVQINLDLFNSKKTEFYALTENGALSRYSIRKRS